MQDSFTIGAAALSGIDAFLKVAKHRNFRRAAEELGLSASAVSQQIKGLEDRLGVPLLNRTTRSVGLTQAGQVFLRHAGPAMAGLQQAYEDTRNLLQPSGLLRLHVPQGAIPMLIEPILGDFCAAYPQIDLEVLSDVYVSDLVTMGFDAGVQLSELLDADAIALRLSPPIRFVVVGAPGYFERQGRPASPGDLRDHQCVRLVINGEKMTTWTLFDGGRPLHVPITGRMVSDDYALCVASALNGLGLFQAAENVVAEAVARGELEIVLDDYAMTSDGLFLHYPSRAQAMPKLRAFIDFVRNHLGR